MTLTIDEIWGAVDFRVSELVLHDVLPVPGMMCSIPMPLESRIHDAIFQRVQGAVANPVMFGLDDE